MNKAAYIVPLALVAAACSPKSNMRTITVPSSNSVAVGWSQGVKDPRIVNREPLSSAPVSAVLKASAVKIAPEYADKVGVTLDASGNLVYFPDPSDVRPQFSQPVEIGDGWWLNRQGIGPRSVFTDWTFEEYSKLKQVPSAEEIKSHIIPGSGVSEFQTLPFPAGSGTQHLTEIKKILNVK